MHAVLFEEERAYENTPTFRHNWRIIYAIGVKHRLTDTYTAPRLPCNERPQMITSLANEVTTADRTI